MARRPTQKVIEITPATSAIDDVLEAQNERSADELAGILDELQGISDNSKVLVYKQPPKGGNWQYLTTIPAPIPTTVLDELKANYGGGAYQMRIYTDGAVRAHRRVDIAGAAKDLDAPAVPVQNNGINEIFPVLMQHQQKSSSDMVTMMQMMMQQQANASAEQNKMLMGLATVLIPIMAGNKTDPVQLATTLAAAMKPADNGGGLKDTLALLASAKELFGGGDGGGGDENMVQTALKAFGPAMGAVIEKGISAPPQPALSAPSGMVSRSEMPRPPGAYPPAPRPAMPPLPRPATMQPQAQPAYKSHPVLRVIGDDLMFMAARNYSPELAAEAILDRLEAAKVGENDIMALAIQFQTSPDWIADLAKAGVNLVSYREWAGLFIGELIAQYTNGERGNTDSSGGNGGETDADEDGGVSEHGV